MKSFLEAAADTELYTLSFQRSQVSQGARQSNFSFCAANEPVKELRHFIIRLRG